MQDYENKIKILSNQNEQLTNLINSLKNEKTELQSHSLHNSELMSQKETLETQIVLLTDTNHQLQK